MLFIYWGWDTTVSVNEETFEPEKTPGRAAVLSTVGPARHLRARHASRSSPTPGSGTTGIGLGNPANQGDVLSDSRSLGLRHVRLRQLPDQPAAAHGAELGRRLDPDDHPADGPHHSGHGRLQGHPLVVLSRIHKRFLTPTVSTVVMGLVSIALYVSLNYISAGTVIADSVSALGVMIAFYYGLTGLSCFWYYRKTLGESARNLWLRGILPLLGWAMLWGASSATTSGSTGSPVNSYTTWHMAVLAPLGHRRRVRHRGPDRPRRHRPGREPTASVRPAFFRGEVLNRDTPTMVPEDLGGRGRPLRHRHQPASRRPTPSRPARSPTEREPASDSAGRPAPSMTRSSMSGRGPPLRWLSGPTGEGDHGRSARGDAGCRLPGQGGRGGRGTARARCPVPDEVVLEVSYCGICGSDIHILLEGWGDTPGHIAGHEYTGTIAALGRERRGLADRRGRWSVARPRGAAVAAAASRASHRSARTARARPATSVTAPSLGYILVRAAVAGPRPRGRELAPRRPGRAAGRRSPWHHPLGGKTR